MANKSKQAAAVATPTVETNPPAALVPVVQSERGAAMAATLSSLFSADLPGKMKLERRGMPRIVKPGDVPMGQSISGFILKTVPSPVTTVKGVLVWMQHAGGEEFLFPLTGVVRQALVPGTEAEGVALIKAMQEHKGKFLVLRRLADAVSGKYHKAMFVFDVLLSETPVDNPNAKQ